MIFDRITDKGINYTANTYVMVNDEIFYALANGASLNLYSADDLGKDKPSHRVTNDNCKGFEFSSPMLGYMYSQKFAGKHFPYFKRMSQRQWKTGICDNNVTDSRILRMEPQAAIMDAFMNVRMKNYPNFNDAINLSEKINAPVPFHRRYAVHKDILYYIGEKLGKIYYDKILIDTEFSAPFHTDNIESLTGLKCTFVTKKKINFGKDDI